MYEQKEQNSSQNYVPKVNDYVQWNDLQGWVYFKCEEYITIEISVKDKPYCEYSKSDKHQKVHCCVVCFPENFSELRYVKSRQSVHG